MCMYVYRSHRNKMIDIKQEIYRFAKLCVLFYHRGSVKPVDKQMTEMASATNYYQILHLPTDISDSVRNPNAVHNNAVPV